MPYEQALTTVSKQDRVDGLHAAWREESRRLFAECLADVDDNVAPTPVGAPFPDDRTRVAPPVLPALWHIPVHRGSTGRALDTARPLAIRPPAASA